VFRRGPSDWTAVLTWHLDRDDVTLGDWFRGQVYARRCDLSPDGRRLVYFAANFGSRKQSGFEYGHSWTAISEPPSLKPLVYWSKGDCWMGGGLFASNSAVQLNEVDGRARPAVPTDLSVTFDRSAHGEDEPLYGRRLQRDGFTQLQPLIAHYDSGRFATTQPEIRVKRSTDGQSLELARSLEGFTDVHRYTHTTAAGTRAALPRVTWADFDSVGRLVCARDGQLLASHGDELELVADLNDLPHPTP
jgi:hypothetical protein